MYKTFAVPSVMLYCDEVRLDDGVERRSATMLEMIETAAVWELAVRFVSIPRGSRLKSAIKQNPAIPSARVSSTKENPEWELL